MVRGRVILFAVLFAAASVPVPSAAGQVMDWSSPFQLDSGSPSQLSNGSGIDCVGEQLCVATGGAGRVLVSTSPTGGAAAWQEVTIEEVPANLTSVSCPSVSFCAAVDDAGHLLTSAEPGGGGASWTAATIDPGQELVDISCSKASFCAAIDDAGNALVSDEPSGGAGAWESAQVLESGELRAISCPSASLCLAVHDELGVGGGLLVSGDPLAGASSWKESDVDLANAAYDVSCPSETFCAIAYWEGVLVSNNPAGAGAWRSSQSGEYVNGISCPSEGFCVGESYGGDLRVSSDPAGEDPTWTEFDISPNWVNLLSGIDCTSDSFCAMVDQQGFVYTSTEPGAGPQAWRQLLTGEVEPSVGSPSCPTAGFCAVAGTLGRIYTSTNPTNPAGWQAATVTEGEVWSVSCSAPDWCVALGEGPTLLYSDEPGAGASAWNSVSRPEGRKIACPSSGFCAMLAGEDEVLTSNEPLGGAATWTATDLELPDWRLGPNRLTQLSCPTADLCAVAGDVGTVLASEEPSGGGTWVKSFIGTNDPYNNGAGPSVDGLDCTVASFCAATTWAGTVATTSDPLTGSTGWTLSSAPATYFIGPISCADEVPLCVAVDSNGYAIASREPGQLSSSWGTMEKIDGEEELNGISCASEGALCVASDRDGRVIVGTPGEEEGGSGGGGPSPPPTPPGPPPEHHCKRKHNGKPKRMGIAPARKVSSGGKPARSRCGRRG